MNSLTQDCTRFFDLRIPLFCLILGVNSTGYAGLETTGTHTTHLEPESYCALHEVSGGQSRVDGYVPGTAYLLEFFLKNLSNILDDPTLDQFGVQGSGTTLQDDADMIILGYPMFGIDPSIGSAEIEFGLDDAHTILDILKFEPELVNLDESTCHELEISVTLIIEELENGE